MIFTLNGAHDNSVTTIAVVEATTAAAATGYLKIESEIIQYGGKGANSFTGCTRGSLGSSAASHATGLLLSIFWDTTPHVEPQKEYDINSSLTIKPATAISSTTVNINAMIVGSAWIILDLDNNRTVRASGTASTANISTTFENFAPFNAMIYVRKLGYIPAEYPVYINSGLTTIYVSQKADAFAGLSLAAPITGDGITPATSEWLLNYSTKKIGKSGSYLPTTRHSVLEFYVWLMGLFDNQAQMSSTIPIAASTPVEFSLINDWTFNDDSDLNYLYGGSIIDTTTDSLWANFYTIGSLVSGSVVYWQQGTALVPTYTGYTSGPCDQLIRTKLNGAWVTGSDGTVTAFVRDIGNTYDSFSATGTDTGGRNPVPVATAIDPNDSNLTSSDGGISITFGDVSKDTGVGGAATYAVVIDGNGMTCAEVYKALKYRTRGANSAAIGTGNSTPGRFYLQAAGTTPTKEAPFCRMNGVQLYGSQGVWIEGVSDLNNIAELYDSANVKHTFPTSITISANVSLLGTEIRIYDLDNSPSGSLGTELVGTESNASSNFVVTTLVAGNIVWIQIMKAGYEEFGLEYTVPSGSANLPVTLTSELNA